MEAEDRYKLNDELQDYILTPKSELPPFNENTSLEHFRLCKDQFPQLGGVSRIVLSVAHSNADTENLFSAKKSTDSRGNLKVKTINSVLSVKLNNPKDCHTYQPKMDLVKSDMRSCTNYTERLTEESNENCMKTKKSVCVNSEETLFKY